MSTAEQIYKAAFATPRSPRSDAYKLEVRCALQLRLGVIEEIPVLYPSGTAKSDAFYAGLEEGYRLAREHQQGGAA